MQLSYWYFEFTAIEHEIPKDFCTTATTYLLENSKRSVWKNLTDHLEFSTELLWCSVKSFRSRAKNLKSSCKILVNKTNKLGLSNDESELFFQTDSTLLLGVFINQANNKPESSFDNYNGHRQKIHSIPNDVTHHHFS